MNYKKCIVIFLAEVILVLGTVGLLVYYVDPFFHYRKPNPHLFYPLDGGLERYVNDGILKHFKYDSIITGTSMTENFKVSKCNDLYASNTIKVPFSGATYKEINDNIAKAFKTGREIKFVIRSLDLTHLVENKNKLREDLGAYPLYLYNDEVLDDFSYLLNSKVVKASGKILLNGIRKKRGVESFDKYANWNSNYKFGKKSVLGDRKMFFDGVSQKTFGPSDVEMLKENIEQNVISLAKEHPETTFYCFFPPYSIVYWGSLKEKGELDYILSAKSTAIDMLLDYDNIKLYSFDLETHMTTNLDNYKDETHYGEWINDAILQWMKEGYGLITKNNHVQHIERERKFFQAFDYNRILDKNEI